VVKLKYRNVNEIDMFKNIYNILLELIAGKEGVLNNNNKEIDYLMNKYFVGVEFFDYNADPKEINPKKPALGVCDEVKKHYPYIKVVGLEGTNNSIEKNRAWYNLCHEMVHAFSYVLPVKYEQNRDGLIRNTLIRGNTINTLRKNNNGFIEMLDYDTKRPITNCNLYYGDLFRETMMDLFTLIAYSCSKGRKDLVDNILKGKYKNVIDHETGYHKFIPLTAMMIAYSFNCVPANYSSFIENGYSICNNISSNGLFINDFLYSVLFDPLHMDKNFNKIHGGDLFRLISTSLDNIKFNHLSSSIDCLPKDDIKRYVILMLKASIEKAEYLINNNLLNKDDIIKYLNNCCNVAKNVLGFYKINYNKEEIDKYSILK